MDNSQIKSILTGCELFSELEEHEIGKIAVLCMVQEYSVGEYLFRQGDFCENLFIVAEGQVFLERVTDLGAHKGKVTIGILGKGRALGCWSTLLDDAHNLMSSAICQKPATALVIKGAALRQEMVQNEKLGFRILERLCFLLRDRIQSAYGAMEKI